MFQIVAIPFDAFQALPCAKSRWLLACLARYTNRAGECWPTMRQLTVDAAMSLASVSRHLKAMHEMAVFQRERLPGGGRYRYTLAERFRLRWPERRERVSAVQNRVSQDGAPEQARPKKHIEKGRFANLGVSYSDLPDDRAKWQARLRGWRKSRFWLPMWGPKPDQPGHFVPAGLLQTSG